VKTNPWYRLVIILVVLAMISGSFGAWFFGGLFAVFAAGAFIFRSVIRS